MPMYANVWYSNEVCIKLLEVHIDKDLTFNYHIENICKKAAKQVNAMYTECQSALTKLLLKPSFILS